jgi:hypothetical protein
LPNPNTPENSTREELTQSRKAARLKRRKPEQLQKLSGGAALGAVLPNKIEPRLGRWIKSVSESIRRYHQVSVLPGLWIGLRFFAPLRLCVNYECREAHAKR